MSTEMDVRFIKELLTLRSHLFLAVVVAKAEALPRPDPWVPSISPPSFSDR